jgi:hypothetical protein
MNAVSSPSIVLTSGPRTGRRVGAMLRATVRAFQLHWEAYRAERRQARALGAVSEMDVHMLRDIGAPYELISRATAQSARHGRDIPFQLWMVLVAIAVIGTATPTSAGEAAHVRPARGVHAAGQMPGVFTGEFLDGAPVYRFPAVVVTGSRKPRPAEREVQSTPPRQTRATSARVAA